MDAAEIQDFVRQAKSASLMVANASSAQKKGAITDLAALLRQSAGELLQANAQDIEAAEANGLDAARIDRLRLSEAGVNAMASACEEVAAMDDPVGSIESMHKRPNGLLVGQMRIPLGLVAMIYESRPNVTIDAGILCLMAGNGVLLRGGSEAFHSNQALARVFQQALENAGLPPAAVSLLPTTDRAAVQTILQMDEAVDVVIPRGGEGLIRAVTEQARMPVLKHFKGVCHTYVDASADLEAALEIVENAKVQRPGVCNAMECLLVHTDIAKRFLPAVGKRLGAAGVRFRACERSLPLLGDTAQAATEQDWGHEFLDLILAVKVVENQEQAQAHIATYGSNHSEAILTADHNRAMRFLREVDASAVFVNASTRFNDGGELGLGAEIGISTSKLHAYGPMGINELTSKKFVLLGEGQVRS
ncbi:MAG: glutamate-5-semialdehyde dehydrogenase [Thermodesulfobacteriota bacterium]